MGAPMSNSIRAQQPTRAGEIVEIRQGLYYVRLDGAAPDSRVVFHPAAWIEGFTDAGAPKLGERVVLVGGSPVEWAYRP
jgi:hypothetical protein